MEWKTAGDAWQNGFPEDVFRRVLVALDTTTIARCARTCRRWRDMVYSPDVWVQLDLSHMWRLLDDKRLATILQQPRFRELQALSLEGCGALTLGSLDTVARFCPRLRYLWLTHCTGLLAEVEDEFISFMSMHDPVRLDTFGSEDFFIERGANAANLDDPNSDDSTSDSDGDLSADNVYHAHDAGEHTRVDIRLPILDKPAPYAWVDPPDLQSGCSQPNFRYARAIQFLLTCVHNLPRLRYLELYGATTDVSVVSWLLAVKPGLLLGNLWLTFCAATGVPCLGGSNWLARHNGATAERCRHADNPHSEGECWGEIRGRVIYSQEPTRGSHDAGTVEEQPGGPVQRTVAPRDARWPRFGAQRADQLGRRLGFHQEVVGAGSHSVGQGLVVSEVLYSCRHHRMQDAAEPSIARCPVCGRWFRLSSMIPTVGTCKPCLDASRLVDLRSWVDLREFNRESHLFSQHWVGPFKNVMWPKWPFVTKAELNRQRLRLPMLLLNFRRLTMMATQILDFNDVPTHLEKIGEIRIPSLHGARQDSCEPARGKHSLWMEADGEQKGGGAGRAARRASNTVRDEFVQPLLAGQSHSEGVRGTVEFSEGGEAKRDPNELLANCGPWEPPLTDSQVRVPPVCPAAESLCAAYVDDPRVYSTKVTQKPLSSEEGRHNVPTVTNAHELRCPPVLTGYSEVGRGVVDTDLRRLFKRSLALEHAAAAQRNGEDEDGEWAHDGESLLADDMETVLPVREQAAVSTDDSNDESGDGVARLDDVKTAVVVDDDAKDGSDHEPDTSEVDDYDPFRDPYDDYDNAVRPTGVATEACSVDLVVPVGAAMDARMPQPGPAAFWGQYDSAGAAAGSMWSSAVPGGMALGGSGEAQQGEKGSAATAPDGSFVLRSPYKLRNPQSESPSVGAQQHFLFGRCVFPAGLPVPTAPQDAATEQPRGVDANGWPSSLQVFAARPGGAEDDAVQACQAPLRSLGAFGEVQEHRWGLRRGAAEGRRGRRRRALAMREAEVAVPPQVVNLHALAASRQRARQQQQARQPSGDDYAGTYWPSYQSTGSLDRGTQSGNEPSRTGSVSASLSVGGDGHGTPSSVLGETIPLLESAGSTGSASVLSSDSSMRAPPPPHPPSPHSGLEWEQSEEGKATRERLVDPATLDPACGQAPVILYPPARSQALRYNWLRQYNRFYRDLSDGQAAAVLEQRATRPAAEAEEGKQPPAPATSNARRVPSLQPKPRQLTFTDLRLANETLGEEMHARYQDNYNGYWARSVRATGRWAAPAARPTTRGVSLAGPGSYASGPPTGRIPQGQQPVVQGQPMPRTQQGAAGRVPVGGAVAPVAWGAGAPDNPSPLLRIFRWNAEAIRPTMLEVHRVLEEARAAGYCSATFMMEKWRAPWVDDGNDYPAEQDTGAGVATNRGSQGAGRRSARVITRNNGGGGGGGGGGRLTGAAGDSDAKRVSKKPAPYEVVSIWATKSPPTQAGAGATNFPLALHAWANLGPLLMMMLCVLLLAFVWTGSLRGLENDSGTWKRETYNGQTQNYDAYTIKRSGGGGDGVEWELFLIVFGAFIGGAVLMFVILRYCMLHCRHFMMTFCFIFFFLDLGFFFWLLTFIFWETVIAYYEWYVDWFSMTIGVSQVAALCLATLYAALPGEGMLGAVLGYLYGFLGVFFGVALGREFLFILMALQVVSKPRNVVHPVFLPPMVQQLFPFPRLLWRNGALRLQPCVLFWFGLLSSLALGAQAYHPLSVVLLLLGVFCGLMLVEPFVRGAGRQAFSEDYAFVLIAVMCLISHETGEWGLFDAAGVRNAVSSAKVRL